MNVNNDVEYSGMKIQSVDKVIYAGGKNSLNCTGIHSKFFQICIPSRVQDKCLQKVDFYGNFELKNKNKCI